MKREKEEVFNSIGKNIRRIRRFADISQMKLAEMVHIDISHMNAIENVRNKPSIDLLIDIANALNVDVRDLFREN